MIMQLDEESSESWLDQARRIIVYCRKWQLAVGKCTTKMSPITFKTKGTCYSKGASKNMHLG